MKTVIKYPYIVRPIKNGWEVLCVRSGRPFRVADFDERGEACLHAENLNEKWRLEHRAWIEARCAIFRTQERAASAHNVGLPASVWKLLKALVRSLS